MDRLFPRSVFHALRQAEHVPDRAGQPAGRADRGQGGGAAAARPGPQRAGVPAARTSCSTTCRRSSLSLQGCIRDVGEAVSLQYFHAAPWVGRADAAAATRDRSEGRTGLAHPGRAHHRLLLRDAGALVVQRGAADPAHRHPAERDRQPGRDHARHPAPTGTPTTGAPRSRRSTCTPRTPSWPSPRRPWWRRPTRSPRPAPPPGRSWRGRGARPLHRDAGVHRLRRPRPRARPKVARALARRQGRPPTPCSRAARWVREHLTYQPGTTGVHTSALEAWEARTGVCQDFAHLTLLLLREVGIPARYVSGYLLPEARRRGPADRARREPRLDRGLDGRLVGLRPHQRHRDRPPARLGGRRAATTPTSRRSRASTPAASRLGARRHGRHDPARLTEPLHPACAGVRRSPGAAPAGTSR